MNTPLSMTSQMYTSLPPSPCSTCVRLAQRTVGLAIRCRSSRHTSAEILEIALLCVREICASVASRASLVVIAGLHTSVEVGNGLLRYVGARVINVALNIEPHEVASQERNEIEDVEP